MKKLHLKDGMSFKATASTEYNGRYIAIFEDDGKLLYSVFAGGRDITLLLRDGISELPMYMVCQAVEIWNNFNQYHAMLSQNN